MTANITAYLIEIPDDLHTGFKKHRSGGVEKIHLDFYVNDPIQFTKEFKEFAQTLGALIEKSKTLSKTIAK